MVTVSGNPNPTNPTYPTNPTNPTNPTTKYRCEFGTLFCIYARDMCIYLNFTMLEMSYKLTVVSAGLVI